MAAYGCGRVCAQGLTSFLPKPVIFISYGCVWPCTSNTPSSKRLTYGRVHVHGILLFLTFLPISISNGCRSTYPRIP
eukprot:9441279-Pyramimonas_sp.AAC.1